MGYVLVGLAIISIGIAGCASSAPPRASESEIAAATRQRAGNACQPHKMGDLHIAGCEILPAFIDGEWSVRVEYIVVDDTGKRIGVMGVHTLYLFDKSGKFIKSIPGM